MSKHADKHFARQRKRYASLDIDYGHTLGFKRTSEPVQAWAKAASRIAWAKAHRRIRQTAPVKVLPMD